MLIQYGILNNYYYNTKERVIKVLKNRNDKTSRVNEKIEDGTRIVKKTSRAKREGGLAGKRKGKTNGVLKVGYE